MVTSPSVGVVIPTYNAGNKLARVLRPVTTSPQKLPILVIDSSSLDDTVVIARSFGAQVHVIAKSDFNHGSTRELGRRMLSTDVIVMMTQDVVPVGEGMIARLVAPLIEGKAVVSYARQIPHDGADFFESFPRWFNYPEISELRSWQDTKKFGAYTFFCSDSCAAWLNTALDEIGGFPHTGSLEDTIAVAKLLRAGHKIAYCADAVVKHSHSFSLREEFRRYYEVGVARAQQRELLMIGRGDEGRGAAFMSEMLRQLIHKQPSMVPYAILSAVVKWAGYRIGWHSAKPVTV